MSSAKVSKRPMTAGRAKKIAKNSLVHIILAILVVIWLFPIFWIIMTSLRGESGAYTAYPFQILASRRTPSSDRKSTRLNSSHT